MGRVGNKLLSVVMSAVLVLSLAPFAPAFASEESSGDNAEPVDSPPEGTFVPGELLVAFDNSQQGYTTAAHTLGTDSRVQDVQTLARPENGDVEIAKVTVADDSQVDAMVAELKRAPDVRYAQRNYVYGLLEDGAPGVDAATATVAAQDDAVAPTSTATPLDTVNDPRSADQYYLGGWNDEGTFGADVYDAWDMSKSEDAGVTIAILDTGARATHEDLNANIDTANMIDMYYHGKPGSINDYDGHGTHVAGIAAGVANNGKGIAGTSYNATVLPIKVFDNGTEEPTTNSAVLVEAYDYLDSLVEQGKISNLHVVNMSLGGYGALSSDDYALQTQIKEMRDDHDVLTVCAGGNGDRFGNPITSPNYPSDFDEVLSVTALTQAGANTSWSDYNQYKDISAPGVNILSSFNRSDSDYDYLDGTSMASPLVAGIAALLWGAVPQLTVDEAVASIKDTANDVVRDANFHEESGSAGAIDAAAAVSSVVEQYGGDTRKSIRDAEVTAPEYVLYDGTPKQPTVGVSYQGTPLVEGVDYFVTYENNTEAGTAQAVVHGKGNYRGTKRVAFQIAYDLAGGSGWIGAIAAQKYTGEAVEPKVTVGFNRSDATPRLLKQDVDYTLTFANNVEAGTATVSVEGKGLYRGTLQTTFRIGRIVSVPQAKNAVYSGEEHQALQEGAGFELSGQARAVDAGDYVATVTPRAGYAWPDGTRDAVELPWSIAKAQLTATYVGDRVFVGEEPSYAVRVEGFVNGESAETAKGFALPVVSAPAQLVPGTTEMLVPEGGSATNYAFTYVGGTLRVVAGEQGSPMQRLAGPQAYQTSAVVSKEAFDSADTVVIARDDDFADAMSAAGLAGELHAPILLTKTDALAPETAAEVERLHAKTAYIVGGENAVSPVVDQALKGRGLSVQRVWGQNSWDTAAASAQLLMDMKADAEESSDAVVVATSNTFEDALSMSSFAYAHKAPILTTMEGGSAADRPLPEAARALLTADGAFSDATVYAAGGPDALAPQFVEDVVGSTRTIRLAGRTGYDTSAAIAAYMVRQGLLSADTVALASGAPSMHGSDALSGAALAGLHGGLLLLVNGNGDLGPVDTTTVDGFLARHASDVVTAYALGGEVVMPSSVVDDANRLLS